MPLLARLALYINLGMIKLFSRAASPLPGSALSVCKGLVFSVDVAGFSLGSVYTDE